jgi:hypothetical protein
MMEYRIEIPRTSFDGLCRFLQQWARIYSEPNAVVLRGSLRNPFGAVATSVMDSPTGAAWLSAHYTQAANALGRSKVTKTTAVLDLRDLEDEETQAIGLVAHVALLRGPQTRVMDRLAKETAAFLALPDMVRIALAAVD